MVLGDSLAHDTRCPGVGNWPMSSPTSAMMTWAAWRPMPATSSRRSTTGRGAASSSPVWGSTRSLSGWPGTDPASAIPAWTVAAVPPPGPGAGCWLGGTDRSDCLLDPHGELVISNLAAEGVDLVQQHPRQLRVMVVEAAGEGLHQGGVLDAEPTPGQLGQQLRIALAGDQRL